MNRTSMIMFKVGEMYVESVSMNKVTLTTFRCNAMEIDEEYYREDRDALTKAVMERSEILNSKGLFHNVIREVIETREYVDNVMIRYSGNKPMLAIERKEQ